MGKSTISMAMFNSKLLVITRPGNPKESKSLDHDFLLKQAWFDLDIHHFKKPTNITTMNHIIYISHSFPLLCIYIYTITIYNYRWR